MLNCCICVRSIKPQNIISYWLKILHTTYVRICFCCKFVCRIRESVIILSDPEPSFLSRTVIETGSKPCVYFYSNFFSRMSEYDCCAFFSYIPVLNRYWYRYCSRYHVFYKWIRFNLRNKVSNSVSALVVKYRPWPATLPVEGLCEYSGCGG